MTNKSEIYSQGYEKWEGDRRQPIPPWWLIASNGVTNIVSSSGCLARFVFGAFFIIYYFNILLVTFFRFQAENIKKIDALRPFAEVFTQIKLDVPEIWYHKHAILYYSLSFSVLAMVFYGSQLISKDKRANALQVYFSKAVSRFDYLLGKFLSVGLIIASVTLIPSALMLICGLLFTTDHLTFLAEAWYIPLVVVAYWLVLTLVFGSVVLFFSANFDKSYMAGVSFLGFMMFCSVMTNILGFIFGAQAFFEGWNWVFSLHGIGTALFDVKVESGGGLFWQVADLGILVALMIVLMLRKIRPVEVVS